VAHAGIVDEDVDRAEGVDRGLHRGVDVGALRDVAAHGNRLVADRRRGVARGLSVDVDDGNARAFAREGGGNALAGARAPTGDERNLVVETHVTFPLAALPAVVLLLAGFDSINARPAQAVFGSCTRAVFATDPFAVAETIERGEDLGIVHLALVGLAPRRHG